MLNLSKHEFSKLTGCDERGHKAHVHVVKARGTCKILLDATLTPYDIRMVRRDVQRARTAGLRLQQRRAHACCFQALPQVRVAG